MPRHLWSCQVPQVIPELIVLLEHLIINICEAVASGLCCLIHAPGQADCLTSRP